jgi:hypothetical protein
MGYNCYGLTTTDTNEGETCALSIHDGHALSLLLNPMDVPYFPVSFDLAPGRSTLK